MQTNIIAFEETYNTAQVLGVIQGLRAELTSLLPGGIQPREIVSQTPESPLTSDQVHGHIKDLREIFESTLSGLTTEPILVKDYNLLLKNFLEKSFEQELLLGTRYTVAVSSVGKNSYSVKLVEGSLVSGKTPILSEKTILIYATRTHRGILKHLDGKQSEFSFREATNDSGETILSIISPWIKYFPLAQ